MQLLVTRSKLNSSMQWHAFVEYDAVELAEKAVSDFYCFFLVTPWLSLPLTSFSLCNLVLQVLELNDVDNWRNGLKVHLLLRRAVSPDYSVPC